MKEITLQAEGITCTGCAMDMETVLNDKDGIISALVEYRSGRVNIEFDPDDLNESEVQRMVNDLGFPASIVPAE